MFKAILLPVDLAAATWGRPLDFACTMGRAEGATLHLLTVVPDYGMSIVGSFFPPDYESAALEKARAELEPLIEEVRGRGLAAEGHVAHGSIYDEILRAADRLGCDAIVMGAHRPELRDYLLGPNAARVVRHAKQSVMVVRES